MRTASRHLSLRIFVSSAYAEETRKERETQPEPAPLPHAECKKMVEKGGQVSLEGVMRSRTIFRILFMGEERMRFIVTAFYGFLRRRGRRRNA